MIEPPVFIDQFPHCDPAVLHAPGECRFCDQFPDWQALRIAWRIAFTTHKPVGDEMSCPSDFRRGLAGAHGWSGNRAYPAAAEPPPPGSLPYDDQVPVNAPYVSRTRPPRRSRWRWWDR